MLTTFICGAGSFHQGEDDGSRSSTPSSSPKKSRRSSRRKRSKNPYATRGLDKFSALLADLDEKRQKIYSQVDAQEISLVRFVCSNSNDWVPIVVKAKDRKEDKPKEVKTKEEKTRTGEIEVKKESSVDLKEVKQTIMESNEKPKKKSLSRNMKLEKWRQPSYYLPVVVILILLLLLLFGKSFAILCTCVGWYIIPTLTERSNTERPTKKKEYARRLSEKKMASEHVKERTMSDSREVEGKSPRRQGHWRSW